MKSNTYIRICACYAWQEEPHYTNFLLVLVIILQIIQGEVFVKLSKVLCFQNVIYQIIFLYEQIPISSISIASNVKKSIKNQLN